MLVYTLNWGGDYAGSISKIIRDIERHLEPEGVRFEHYYESGEKSHKNYHRLSGWVMSHIYYYVEHITGNRYETGLIPAKKFINAVKQGKPDVVHIHCPNGFGIDLYRVLEYLKKEEIPTVVTNHAEFFYTGNCAYAVDCMQFVHGCRECPDHRGRGKSFFFDRSAYTWKRMRNAFDGFKKLIMVGVSPWSVSRIGMSDIAAGLDIRLVENGVDIDVFKRAIDEKKEDDGRINILQVTSRFTLEEDDLKGGKYFWELADAFRDNTDLKFIVAGEYSLENVAIPDNMEFTGVIESSDKLARLYSECDLTVTTSRCETFGMTCAESLCCGTPVAGFINGGSDSVAIPEYSGFVRYGDIDALKNVVAATKKKDETVPAEIENKARERYSSERMAMQYHKIYMDAVMM